MCGIAGWFSENGLTNEQKKKVHAIGTKIFEATQSRGTDASGFSYINRFGELITIKAPISSENMVKEKKWLRLAEPDEFPQSTILHCRQMTKGDPIKNENNHPLVVKKEIALVHNGCISNDEELKKDYELKGKGEVDSEIIPLLIKMRADELKGENEIDSIKIAKAINMTSQELSGGFACALINTKTPDALYLFNHKNPIVLAYCEELKTFFFASTQGLLEDGFKGEKTKFLHKWFKTSPFISHSIDADTITVIRKLEDGKIDITFYEMKTKSYVYQAGVQVKETITRSLKTKNGFSTVIYSANDPEDWEMAAAHGSCANPVTPINRNVYPYNEGRGYIDGFD